MSLLNRIITVLHFVTPAIHLSLSLVKAVDTVERYHLCGLDSVSSESPDERHILDLRSYLVRDTPNNGFNSKLKFEGYYGQAACNLEISRPECDACLINANSQLFQKCEDTIGGQIKLGDCRLRFEHYEFPEDW